MAQSVILPEAYECLLEYEGILSGTLTSVLKKEDYPDVDFDNMNQDLKDGYNRYKSQRQKFYQTILLYDDLVIPQADPTIDYSRLETYGFSIHDLDDSLSYNAMNEADYKERAALYKPVILKRWVKDSNYLLSVANPPMSPKKTASILYDYSLMLRPMGDEDMVVVNRYRDNYVSSLDPELRKMEERNGYNMTFGTAPFLFSDLSWQLNVSADHNAYIVNSYYDLSNLISCDKKLAAYRILKVSYGDIIHELPGFNSLQEVLYVKKSKKREINALRTEIDGLESILMSSNPDREEKARETAVKDIKKAVKAVNHGLPIVNMIGNWSSILGIPVSAVDYYSGLPPIISGALTVTSGIMAMAGMRVEKNRWFEIIR